MVLHTTHKIPRISQLNDWIGLGANLVKSSKLSHTCYIWLLPPVHMGPTPVLLPPFSYVEDQVFFLKKVSKITLNYFQSIGPLGRCFHRVAMSVCLSVYPLVIFFEASHWPSGHMINTRPLIGHPSFTIKISTPSPLRICVFSIWPLPEVENWFKKQTRPRQSVPNSWS